MEQRTWTSRYFYGHELSRESLDAGRMTYADLVAPFSVILANSLRSSTYDIGYWELENGSDVILYDHEGNEIDRDSDSYWADDYEEQYLDIYQEYIIEPAFVTFLEEYTEEIIWYNAELDLYVWGVTHWGTPWNGVYTSIKVEI